jgi:antirestriction protein
MSERETSQETQGRSEEQEQRLRPKVWIASLSDYNAGHLHGAWADADQNEDGLWNDINEVLRSSLTPGAEEWAIFDYEEFGPLRLSEYEAPERISKLGRGIAEHGEAFAAFAHFLGSDDDYLDRFEDCYLGSWATVEAYAENYIEDSGIERALDAAVPEGLRPYVKVDVELLARGMQFEGALLALETSSGEVSSLAIPMPSAPDPVVPQKGIDRGLPEVQANEKLFYKPTVIKEGVGDIGEVITAALGATHDNAVRPLDEMGSNLATLESLVNGQMRHKGATTLRIPRLQTHHRVGDREEAPYDFCVMGDDDQGLVWIVPVECLTRSGCQHLVKALVTAIEVAEPVMRAQQVYLGATVLLDRHRRHEMGDYSSARPRSSKASLSKLTLSVPSAAKSAAGPRSAKVALPTRYSPTLRKNFSPSSGDVGTTATWPARRGCSCCFRRSNCSSSSRSPAPLSCLPWLMFTLSVRPHAESVKSPSVQTLVPSDGPALACLDPGQRLIGGLRLQP